ncbi:phage tail protein [Pseudomonas sp. NPDC088890]|uniref:phage tail protein n=1 Tax=Pseudomonas sp. NPDC088890 TaxID=3364458 RepID=UPI00384F0F0E
MVDQTSQFYAILTNVGAAKQANADALGIPWTITQMAVGDGNPSGVDNPVLPMPTAAWTSLLNEWRRAPLNQLKVDEKNNAVIVAEQVIPADVGGRWIREIALYDADGDMVAVANCAPTFKPLLSQGSGRTQVVRLNLIVSSSSNVQLKIDPSVVLATREWVTEELAKQDFKHSVLAATTDAITLSGLQTIDGVALPAGSRVLVKNQAAAKDNGLYQVVAGGPWTRCADADTSAKVTPGLLVMVERGTVNSDTAWQLLTDATIALGVTGLTFGLAFGRTGIVAGTYRSVTVDIYGRVVAATNPTTAAGYGLTDVYTKTQVDQALALKASLASPTFTGVPTAPTPAAGTNTNQLANTAFVQNALAALVASSPAALDTLNELAAALGNDPNFAATMTNALAGKVNLADKATQSIAETGADNTKWMTALAVAQSVLKRLNGVGLATSTAPLLATFEAVVSGGLYLAYTGGHPTSPTPGGPPSTGNNLLSVLAISPRADATYYLAFENGSLADRRRFWFGQYNVVGGVSSMFWSSAFTTDQIATQAQVDAGIADDVVITPKKMRFGFTASLAPNGYIVFPSWLGGLVIQWGGYAHGEAVNYVAANVPFNIAFPSACYNVQCISDAGTTTPDLNGFNRTNVGVTIAARDAAVTVVAGTLYWLAIGK